MGTLAPMPPLRGRQAEVAALDEALGRVASGRPAIVLIQGEAGIGKTRLLEEARRRGMQVAAGRAGELERTRPFGLVADACGCARSAPDPVIGAADLQWADPSSLNNVAANSVYQRARIPGRQRGGPLPVRLAMAAVDGGSRDLSAVERRRCWWDLRARA